MLRTAQHLSTLIMVLSLGKMTTSTISLNSFSLQHQILNNLELLQFLSLMSRQILRQNIFYFCTTSTQILTILLLVKSAAACKVSIYSFGGMSQILFNGWCHLRVQCQIVTQTGTVIVWAASASGAAARKWRTAPMRN